MDQRTDKRAQDARKNQDDDQPRALFGQKERQATGAGPGVPETVRSGAYAPGPGDPGGLGARGASGHPSSAPPDDGLGDLSGTSADPLDGAKEPNTRGERASGDLGGVGGQRGPGGGSRD